MGIYNEIKAEGTLMKEVIIVVMAVCWATAKAGGPCGHAAVQPALCGHPS